MSVYTLVEERQEADLLFIPCIEGKTIEESCEGASALLAHFSTLQKLAEFEPKLGKTLLLYPQKEKEPRICLLGLGKKPSTEAVREGYASALRACLKFSCKKVNVLFPDCSPAEEVLEAAFEGLLLANYTFGKYKSGKVPHKLGSPVDHFFLISRTRSSRLDALVEIAHSVYLTRDLINTNADEMTPEKLAQVAIEMAKNRKGLRVEILEKKELESLGMGLFLAVNKGSSIEPKLIVLHYEGDPSSAKKVACVGKGVTFDTGGLSLKPTQFMQGMKADMGGAGTVFGLIDALSRLQVKKNVIGVIPSTENAIDGNSYKVGDIYTSYSGKTVEIDNTDAEGRLILADALSYTADKYSPDLMIDLATLTGAIVVSLGEDYAGLFSNNLPLQRALEHASQAVGERFWPMPLHRPYFSLLRSDFADTKNSGSREAGSITAALFLREFIRDLPWAHLDIAGCAFRSRESGCFPKNASGEVVRSLVEFISSLDEATLQKIQEYEVDCSSS
ncbi:MAG: leucyl aminopeptidase [Chlamydiota bacterium]